jgi:mediator of RNA polymerase II transcription subunit 23
MAVACIWIHIVKKAQTEQQNAQKEIAAAAAAASTAGATGTNPSPAASTGGKTDSRAFTTLLQRHFPQALKNHQEFLQHNALNPPSSAPSGDYRVALLCNAFSTTLDCLARPMGSLMESLHGNLSQKGSGNAGGSTGGMPNTGPISPIPLAFLDALTVHAKMSLIHR